MQPYLGYSHWWEITSGWSQTILRIFIREQSLFARNSGHHHAMHKDQSMMLVKQKKNCTQSPGVYEPHDTPANNMRHKFDHVPEGKKTKEFKHRHTCQGDYVSADHDISAVMGWLPHTHGREHKGYQAGTLFVDHTSGNVLNFCQFSTGAAEPVESKHTLAHFAQDKGFKISLHHLDNGIFSSA